MISCLVRDWPGRKSRSFDLLAVESTPGTADVHSLAFDPNDGSRLYFGHHGGLLESRDGGRSWQGGDRLGGGCHEGSHRRGSRKIAGHNVYLESTDGGVTWQHVPSDLPGLDLHAFAINHDDPDRAWALAAGFGLIETTDAAETPCRCGPHGNSDEANRVVGTHAGEDERVWRARCLPPG